MSDRKVVLDNPKWFFARHSTDWGMRRGLMEYVVGEIPSSFHFSLSHNMGALFERFGVNFATRIIQTICRKVRIAILGKLGPITLLYQGANPVFPDNAAVIWETYFLPPQRGESGFGKQFCRGCPNFWMKRMELFGKSAFKIGVRGRHSAEMVKSIFPELSHKVVDLGFIHPEYNVLSESEVVQKQRFREVVNILFVGRLARLKGLPQLLEALIILRSNGVTNFTFTVVSAMRDGDVILPVKEGWVKYFKEVDHKNVMELFRESEIFAMPSYKDSYGLVFHEALASGCVTCVPDRYPQREFVDDGNAGVVLDHFNSTSIADALRPILRDPLVRVRLAMAGRNRYLACYAQSRVRASWDSVIADASKYGSDYV